ncbi:MAG: hypothetical protein BMS9Abin29_2547 [Gemmatimonadota bacterium]|nr:MAG: hypothetical protein BMS9Abin29_2547 [Gemmatimonadota bacterium]
MNGHIDEAGMNDYLDGFLEPAERAAVDKHVKECERCAGDLAVLSDLVAAIGGLPKEAEPNRDVWPDVRGRIATAVEGGKTVQFPGTPRWGRRGITMTMRQLAAASIVLAFVSGGSVWLAMSRTPAASLSTQPALGGPLPMMQAATSQYEQAVASLEEILERERDILGPETLATLETSLQSIEDAIQDAEDALAEDPDSDLLHRLLINHHQAKLRVLHQAAAATRL